MKRKLLFAIAALLCSVGVQRVHAAAADYLTAANGWTQVTSTSGIVTDGSCVYVIASADYASLVVGIPAQNSESQVTYQRLGSQPDQRKVWFIEADSYASGYAFKSMGHEGYYLTATNAWDMNVKATAKDVKETCYSLNFDGEGILTIKTNTDVYSDQSANDGYWWGLWDGDKVYADGETLAGNKYGDNIAKFKLYKSSVTSKSNYGTDATSSISNPSFEDGETFARKTANELGTSIPSWTKAEGGNYQYYTVGASRNTIPDNDSGFGKSITAANGGKYVHIRHGWRNSTTALQQTLTSLPAGEYVISVDYKGATPRSKSPSLTFKTTPVNGSIGGIKYNSFPTSQTRDNTTYTFESNYGIWSTLSYKFDVTATGNVDVYLGFTDSDVMNSSNDEVILDNMTLLYHNYTAALQSALDRANLLYTRTSDSDLKDAIDNAQDVMDAVDNTTSYQSTIDSEVTTLRTAISTAYAKVEFASGEDITFLLENASFESGGALPANVTTSFNNINTTDVYVKMQPVEGWTIGSTEDNILAGAYEYGEDYGISGYTADDITTPVVGHSKAIVMLAGWGAKTQYKQNVTLPAGRYSVTVPVYNKGGATAFTKNLIGFIEDGGTEHLATTTAYTVGSWTTTTVEFDLNAETSGYMSVGYTSKSGEGSGNMPRLYIDGFTITFTDAANAYAATKSAAQTTYDASEYANVKGTASSTERSTLKAFLDADASGYTVAEYFEAVDNINTAVAAFTAAKASYDQYAEAAAIASTISATSVTAPTTAAEATNRAQELNVNIDTKVTSTYTYDVTELYAGSFSGSLSSTNNNQHWSGNTVAYLDNYGTGDLSASQTLSLPAGEYILKMAGRGASSANGVSMSANGTTVNYVLKGDTGRGIAKDGTANFAEVDDTYANSNNGRGWEWRFIPISLAEATDVTVTLTLARPASGDTWGSLSNFTILMSSTDADSDDYAALNSTISTAEGHTLGFEDAQYAPYNNVDVLSKLAVAKSINQAETNAKSAVVGATTALAAANTSGWTANSGDVDAIYNGDFSAGSWSNSTWYPTGWKIVSGWSATVDDAQSSSGKGVYRQPGNTHYGDQGVYTMPLAGGQLYKLTFKYGYRDKNARPQISILNESDEGLAATNCATLSSTYDYKTNIITQTMFFETGAAGNYVLNMNTDQNIIFSDVSLVKATESEITLSESSDFTPASNTYYQTLKLGRTFSTTNYSTMVLPFAMDATATEAAFSEVYSLSTVEGSSIKFATATDIVKAKPYLVKANNATISTSNIMSSDLATVASNDSETADGTTVTFQGTFSRIADVNEIDNSYIVSGDNLYEVNSTVALKPFRAYFTIVTSSPVKNFVLDFGDETAIRSIENGQLAIDNAEIYNLAGQRMSKLQRGVNIVNGKKVLVK